MSRYSGRQGKGARRRTREQKRVEAEVRNEEFQARKAGMAASIKRGLEDSAAGRVVAAEDLLAAIFGEEEVA